MNRPLSLIFFSSLFIVACGSSGSDDPRTLPPTESQQPPSSSPGSTPAPTPSTPTNNNSNSNSNSSSNNSSNTGPLELVAATFNTGISDGKQHDVPPPDGFSSEDAKLNADYYGNGLAWKKAIEDTKTWLATVSPDVMSFQEIFHPGECPNVPMNARAGFICETWKSGDPTVVQTVLGAGYQVACHLNKPDKCVAVKTSFGKFQGCTGALCLNGLAGAPVPGCGSGSRVGRGVIELTPQKGGGLLTIVNVHGSSGFKAEDQACRKKQFQQVFKDLDGAPAANGTMNLVMGDFNTDPARLNSYDESADYLDKSASTGTSTLKFITEKGSNVAPTYNVALVSFLPAGFNIDHVISDKLTGTCVHPSDVTSMLYFDHRPAVCKLTTK